MFAPRNGPKFSTNVASLRGGKLVKNFEMNNKTIIEFGGFPSNDVKNYADLG